MQINLDYNYTHTHTHTALIWDVPATTCSDAWNAVDHGVAVRLAGSHSNNQPRTIECRFTPFLFGLVNGVTEPLGLWHRLSTAIVHINELLEIGPCYTLRKLYRAMQVAAPDRDNI